MQAWNSLLSRGFFLVLFLITLRPAPAATVSDCNETSLRNALSEGGTVNFACDGTIALASTIDITRDTVLDASGHRVTLDGGDAEFIGRATQALDDPGSTRSAMLKGTILPNLSNMEKYHFVDREGLSDLFGKVDFNNPIAADEGKAIGEYLHALEDTFAHSPGGMGVDDGYYGDVSVCGNVKQTSDWSVMSAPIIAKSPDSSSRMSGQRAATEQARIVLGKRRLAVMPQSMTIVISRVKQK